MLLVSSFFLGLWDAFRCAKKQKKKVYMLALKSKMKMFHVWKDWVEKAAKYKKRVKKKGIKKKKGGGEKAKRYFHDHNDTQYKMKYETYVR